MKVLVMGGTRFNGLALVHELVKHGHEVSVFNRGQTLADLPKNVARLTGDRDDIESLRAALAGREFDCVQDISGYTLDHVRNLVELIRGRVGHYIFASSTVTYAATRILPVRETHPDDATERQNAYAHNKLACEGFLFREYRENGFPASTVPFSMVFGPNNILPDREQRMFKRLLLGRPILIPGNGSALSMIGHVDDQARALRMMMLNPHTFGKRYNLTGKDCYSDDGYVDTFAEIVGVEPRRVYVPPHLMDSVWNQPETSFQASFLIQKVAPHIHDWRSSVFFSIDRLRDDTGWEPEYTFASAVAQTYDWFRRDGREATAFDFRLEDDLLARIEAGE